MSKNKPRKPAAEIAIIGDVDDWEEEVVKALLDLPPGGECTFYIDSAGGSVFGALAVVTLLRQRRLNATAIVLGECSSASLLLFAACRQRRVSRFSLFLFHRMRWQSEKRVNAQEALSWAQHFHAMENDLDELQVRLFGKAENLVRSWTAMGQYVTGPQLVAAELAELLDWEEPPSR
jgi:ATP-dependent protease ClpP protease subunit